MAPTTNSQSLRAGQADAPKAATRYVIITPARNEEANIEATIRSVAGQTIRPVEWIIVNDGSTDRTREILDRFAAELPWLHGLDLPDRGFREPGSGVIRAFEHGLRNLKAQEWDFIVKLDSDLNLDPDYFEQCFREFEKDPKLGVGGGTIYHEIDGKLVAEGGPAFHVRGATKIYKRDYWVASNGLYAVPGWDTLDEVKANMLGWTTRSFPHVKIVHRRITGSADGVWKNWFKNGRANYITGYHPLFMLMKCVKRIPEEPFFMGAAGLFCGFASGYLRGVPQVPEPALIRYVRKQQVQRLLLRESIWK